MIDLYVSLIYHCKCCVLSTIHCYIKLSFYRLNNYAIIKTQHTANVTTYHVVQTIQRTVVWTWLLVSLWNCCVTRLSQLTSCGLMTLVTAASTTSTGTDILIVISLGYQPDPLQTVFTV